MEPKKVIITGATGMVGGLALQMCLDSPEVSRVTAVGRSLAGIDHVKLHEDTVNDFNDYSKVADTFENQDAALFCLSVYPNIGISSEDLARAMVHAGLYGTGENENPILENIDIRLMEGK